MKDERIKEIEERLLAATTGRIKVKMPLTLQLLTDIRDLLAEVRRLKESN